MAITKPISGEREDLRFRMDRARSRDEYEYFRDRLREFDRREMMHFQDMAYLHNVPPLMPMPNPLAMDPAAPAKPDPLSFMRIANNKLLLIGATT